MKRNILFLSVWAATIYASSVLFAYPNDSDGFRAFKWGASRKAVSDLRVYEKYGSYAEYIKENEDLDFKWGQATRVLYGFTDDSLEIVTVQFEPRRDEALYDDLKKKLTAEYGEGESIGEKDLFWAGGETNIKLLTIA